MAMALIIFASVMLPTKWEQLRTGHWALEHFVAYFAAALIVCLGWRRPFVVAGGLAAIAAPLLEALQGLEPTHSANFAFRNQRSWRGLGGRASRFRRDLDYQAEPQEIAR
jgi:hypothetical protein